jgi:DNA-binding NtrC family response regulator
MGRIMGDDQKQLAGERVLVVEDEVLVALDLEAILSDAGADVELARTTQAALERLSCAPITVAILDVRLGRDTVSPVASRLAESGIPFVFYTGQSMCDPILADWPDRKIIPKPARSASIVRALTEVR